MDLRSHRMVRGGSEGALVGKQFRRWPGVSTSLALSLLAWEWGSHRGSMFTFSRLRVGRF